MSLGISLQLDKLEAIKKEQHDLIQEYGSNEQLEGFDSGTPWFMYAAYLRTLLEEASGKARITVEYLGIEEDV